MAGYETLQEDSVEEACLQAFSLMYSPVPPMLATTACELGIPDVLHGAGQPLSALQIAERLQHSSDLPMSQVELQAIASRLERVLRCLCAYGVFKVHREDDTAVLCASPHGAHVGGTAHALGQYVAANRSTRYCNNAVSMWLLKTPAKEEHSLRDVFMVATSPAWMKPWEQLTHHILHGGSGPFERALGMPIWQYAKTDPDFNALFNKAMSSDTISIQAFLTHYQGFTSMHTLVDVGGGNGTTAARIVSAYPSLKVVCFDLPHVIATAPRHPGVEYIAGDMFESIPKGNGIILKRILHDWSDEDCVKILKNCLKALLGHGKVIIIDAVMENTGEEQHPYSKMRTSIDVAMLARTSGKERTKDEWGVILKAANFARYNFIDLPCPQCVIEAFST